MSANDVPTVMLVGELVTFSNHQPSPRALSYMPEAVSTGMTNTGAFAVLKAGFNRAKVWQWIRQHCAGLRLVSHKGELVVPEL